MTILLSLVLYDGGGRFGSLTLISSSIVWLWKKSLIMLAFSLSSV